MHTRGTQVHAIKLTLFLGTLCLYQLAQATPTWRALHQRYGIDTDQHAFTLKMATCTSRAQKTLFLVVESFFTSSINSTTTELKASKSLPLMTRLSFLPMLKDMLDMYLRLQRLEQLKT
jgi:hypothetical protein